MRVIATKLGYYDNHRIKEGQEIVLLDEKHFSSLWMEKIEKADSRKSEAPVPAKGKRPEVERDVI